MVDTGSHDLPHDLSPCQVLFKFIFWGLTFSSFCEWNLAKNRSTKKDLSTP